MEVKNVFLGIAKVFLGIFLSLVVMLLAGAATARYFITRLSELPERPLFDNDAPPTQIQDKTSEAVSPGADPTPATPSEPESEPIGLYQVLVIYPDGLLIRSGPGVEYATIGGVDYEQRLTVLQESGRWFKIKAPSGQEGWVKGRDNTQRVN